MIKDRETFVVLDDTEAGFKNIAPDLGVNGGLANKREMSRLIEALVSKLDLPQKLNNRSTRWPKHTVLPTALHFRKIGRL